MEVNIMNILYSARWNCQSKNLSSVSFWLVPYCGCFPTGNRLKEQQTLQQGLSPEWQPGCFSSTLCGMGELPGSPGQLSLRSIDSFSQEQDSMTLLEGWTIYEDALSTASHELVPLVGMRKRNVHLGNSDSS